MSSRAVKNKLPRIIFMYQPSTELAQGPGLFTELKSSLMTVLKMSLWWLPATTPRPHLKPSCTLKGMCFFAAGVHSHIQKQRSEAIVQLQIRQKKEATFCPQGPAFTTGQLHKPQQGVCTGECAHRLCIQCTGALVLDVRNSQTPPGPVNFSRSSFFCVVSLLLPPRFSHFFSGQNSRGRNGRSH